MGRGYKIAFLIVLMAGALALAGCGGLFGNRETSDAVTLPPIFPENTIPVATPAATEETLPAGETPLFPLTLSYERSLAWQAALERADSRIEKMEDRELLLQLLIVTPEIVGKDVPVLNAEESLLEEYPVGGLLIRSQNADSSAQLQGLTAGYQESSRIPLLIMAEEEGGRNVTVMKKLDLPRISNMFSYRGDGLAKAYDNARTIASELADLGINTDLAPVADVWSELENRTIGERAYSDDFEKASQLVAEAVRGFRSQNVICTLKHFPGLDTSVLPTKQSAAVQLERTKQQLLEEDLLPFAAGIQAGADVVMIGNAFVPQLDDTAPAPFSYAVVTLLLRGEVGFHGVVITDELAPALKEYDVTAGSAVLKALSAGCDLILCPVESREDLDECLAILTAAMEAGNLTRERLAESVRRVLALKAVYGIW